MALQRRNRGQTLNNRDRQYERSDLPSLDDALNPDNEQSTNDDGSIVPDWLDPIGESGFFMTPEEPADPTDCERYPNSPWCGGTGLDIDSILDISPATLEPSISFNNCEICLKVETSLFWISLPDNYICYRSKEAACQPKPPPIPPPPPTPPGLPAPIFTPITPILPPGSNCVVTTEYRQFNALYQFGRFVQCIPGEWNLARNSFGGAVGYWSYVDEFRTGRMIHDVVGARQDGTLNGIGNAFSDRVTCPGVEFRQFKANQSCVSNVPPSNVPPSYPPSRRDSCCMACCPSQKDNQEVLDLLKRISKRLGTSDYPIKTPRWLVSNQGNATATHESLTQFNVWFMRQMDALIGEFPIRVQIEDSDPTESGNQQKTVSLPNLAEAVAEIYGLTAKTSIDSDVHTSFLMRLAAEVMAAKTAALVAQDYASANASYLGYQGNEVERPVNFAFDPTALDSIETILKSSSQKIVGWKNDDKENVAAYLQKLMFSAGLLKTVFFRKGNDLNRVLKEVAQFLPDPDAEDSESWREFLRLINNPESPENKGTEVKPEIQNISTKPNGGGR